MDNMEQLVTKTYLKNTSLKLLENWSVQYLLESKFSYNDNFELVPIGSFLIKSRLKTLIEDEKTYQRVTVKINNNGVFPRDTEIGKNIGTKQQYLVKSGQFLMSKIDARNGAFGLVPENLEGAIVTNDFPVFDVDNSVINPEFLVLITTTKEFIKFAQSCSSGTTNRQRIDIDLFLNVKIPLPPLPEQNRIVETYNAKIALAVEQEQKADELEKGIEIFLSEELGIERGKRKIKKNGLQTIAYKEINRWALSYLFKDQRFSMENVKYPIIPLKTLITFFEGGKTPSTSRKDFWGGDVFWTSAKDMKELFLENVQDKITEKGVTEGKMKVYPVGTILGVFRSGILRHSFPVTLTKIETTINQDLKAIGVDETMVIKEYFLFFLKTFQKFILERAQKFGVTVESINADEFLEIPVVLPPLYIQKSICNSIKVMLIEINELRSKSILTKQSAIKEFENEIFKPCN